MGSFSIWHRLVVLAIVALVFGTKRLRNIGEDGAWKFRNEGKVDTYALAGHDTCPTTVDWDKDGDPDLLIGAEDGFLYYLRNTVR